MKQEKARLAQLRSMPYEDYLQTPEWQGVQKAALKRAANTCQGCKADNVPLSVYHTSYENLGCEQEDDVIVLCEACYDRLSRYGQQAEDASEEAGEEQTYSHFSFGKKATVFGGSALVTIGLPLALHAPLPAEVFGLGVAVVLALNSPKIYAQMRDDLPAPLVEWLDRQAERRREREAKGEWNTWDRLWGRHLRDRVADVDAEQLDEEQEEADTAYDDYLNLGPTLKPHADSMLSGRKVILGVSGSGKTNNVNVYIEELGKLRPAPAIILFDTDDENRALCDKKYLPNPISLDKSGGLSAKNAFATAQNIMDHRYQCIINLQSFEDAEAAWIMINMVKGVKAWQEARKVRVPCEIILDEASVWLPQNLKESLLSSILVEDPDPHLNTSSDGDQEDVGKDKAAKDKAIKKISMLALLQRVFFTTVRRGRKRGMGFTLATQRIAEIDKRALQGSWILLMRQTQPPDFREYRKYGISSEEAMGLLDGEGFLYMPGKPLEKHRFRESISPHGGVTPGMEALRRSARGQREADQTEATEPEARELPTETRRQGAKSDSRYETALAAVLQLRGTVDERTFQALLDALPTVSTERAEDVATRTPPSDQSGGQSASRERQQQPRQSHYSRTLNPALQMAYEVYQPGMKHHSLARCLGVSPVVAGQLLQQLHLHGYIDAGGRKVYEQAAHPQKENQENQENQAEYDHAVAVWNNLEADQRNVRDFAAAMNLGETKAWQLLSKLERLGLVQWERRKKKGAV